MLGLSRSKPKNYRVAHAGMGFPVGSVVPAAAYPHGVDGHLHIGSLVETTDPVNVELPESLTRKPADSPVVEATNADEHQDLLMKELADARREVADMAGKAAADRKAAEEALAELERVQRELAEVRADRDEWKSLAEFKASEEHQRDPSAGLPIQTRP